MNDLISRPGLGLGLTPAGQSVQNAPVPVIDLVNPANQSVADPDIQFNEWTMYLKFEDTGAPPSTQKLWYLQLNGSNNAFLHYISNGNIQLTIESENTVQTYYFSSSDYLLGQGDATIIVAAKDNDLTIAVNGIMMYLVDSITMPVGTPTGIGVGQTYGGSQPFTDTMRAFQYYNKRLSDAQIRALGRHKDFGVSAIYDADRLIHFKLGQSNSVGTQATAPAPSVYNNLSRMQLITKNGALDSSYQDPSSHNGTSALFGNFQQNGVFSSGGVEIDGIASANAGKDVAVMHIDRGDTGLVDASGPFRWFAWNTGTANETKLNAPAYQAILMQIIGALHGKTHSRTWWQGESDAGNAGISQFQYRSELVNLLTLFDQYVRVPTIVVGLHDEPSGGRANWSAIQAAQAEINTYYSNAHHVSAAGATTEADEVHLDQAGYISVGGAIAMQINAVT